MKGLGVALFILQRFAELLCTLGPMFRNAQLQQIGVDLWDFVQSHGKNVKGPAHMGRNKGGAIGISVAQHTASGAAIDFSDTENAAIAGRERRLDEILSSNIFDEITCRAATLEPAIGTPRGIQQALLPPYSDGKWGVYRRLCALMPSGPIDTIVCVPWIRVGGADLVACLLADAIKQMSPNERVVIFRVDQPHLERKDWIPEGIDAIDLSGELRSISEDDAEFLLYLLFIGIKPRRIINVNSRLCWQAFRRFGDRLVRQVPLYGYFFCWDQTPSGARAGYPTEFFPTTAHFLSGIFTDTRYLRDELIRIYLPPTSVCARLAVLRSPARLPEPSQPMAIEVSVETSADRSRSKVLWAGRLDRQKRFDLVLAVARLLPDVDFVCWGEALLDRPSVKTSSLPSNLSLNKNFVSFDELPLTSSDCWLFTSDWEGMPTLLIELAMRGVAIVATAVGGVPELLDDTTGWPVAPGSNPETYVQVVRAALADATGRVERARELQNRAIKDFTQSSYRAQVREAFSNAENSIGNITKLRDYVPSRGAPSEVQAKVDQS